MMGVVEAVFAVVGVIFFVLMAIAVAGGAFRQTPSASAEISPANDPALPYREALYTAICIQQAAQEAERELFARARLHTDKEAS